MKNHNTNHASRISGIAAASGLAPLAASVALVPTLPRAVPIVMAAVVGYTAAKIIDRLLD